MSPALPRIAALAPAVAALLLAEQHARGEPPDGGVIGGALDGGTAPDQSPLPAAAGGPPAPAAPALPTPQAPPNPAPAAGTQQRSFGSVVTGQSAARDLRRSAAPVTVVELAQARNETADLGEVLARTEGVGVQRSGGLGSNTRLSLNGFTDNQVRIFVDGVPIGMSGFGLGTGSIPVDFLDRVEIYQGVLPIEFGADALGGAINLVTRERTAGTGGSLSLQAGSFGTYRLTAGGHHGFGQSGFYLKAFAALDLSDNDYLVDVQVADSTGQLKGARVRRFHDGYQAQSGGLEAGVAGRSFAERLAIKVFVSHYNKDLQGNLSLDIPYGEAGSGDLAAGALVFYRHHFWEGRIGVTSRTGFGIDRNVFSDLGRSIYDWFGQQIGPRPGPGEITSGGSNRLTTQLSVYERLFIEARLHESHALELSLAPTYTIRTGKERQLSPDTLDLLTIPKEQTTMVTGLAYRLRLWRRLENVLFAKHYFYSARTQDGYGGVPVTAFNDVRYDYSEFGAGDMASLRAVDQLYLKASVEQTTRLPRPEELFGNFLTIISNNQLRPETSLNANVHLLYDGDMTRAGRFTGEVIGFYRRATNLIALLGQSDVNLQYQNIGAATSMGVQGRVGWISPGRYVALNWNGTWMDYRNRASSGYFAQFDGDRITNTPYLFTNASARLAWRGLIAASDSISLQYYLRYVHSFYRSWESIGIEATKAVVPTQLTQTAALTYEVVHDRRRYVSTLEVDNFTDEKTYDFYGGQRPGRAVFWKGIVELQ